MGCACHRADQVQSEGCVWKKQGEGKGGGMYKSACPMARWGRLLCVQRTFCYAMNVCLVMLLLTHPSEFLPFFFLYLFQNVCSLELPSVQDCGAGGVGPIQEPRCEDRIAVFVGHGDGQLRQLHLHK